MNKRTILGSLLILLAITGIAGVGYFSILHPEDPGRWSTGSNYWGSDLTVDLTSDANASTPDIIDDNLSTRGGGQEAITFDDFVTPNTVWVYLTSGDSYCEAESRKTVIDYSVDGGDTWTKITEGQWSIGGGWHRFQFNGTQIDAFRITTKGSFCERGGPPSIKEVEMHPQMIPTGIDSSLSATTVGENEVFTTDAALVDGEAKVGAMDLTMTIEDSDGTKVLSRTWTTNSEDRLSFTDLIETETYKTNETYTITWSAVDGDLTSEHTFYVPPNDGVTFPDVTSIETTVPDEHPRNTSMEVSVQAYNQSGGTLNGSATVDLLVFRDGQLVTARSGLTTDGGALSLVLGQEVLDVTGEYTLEWYVDGVQTTDTVDVVTTTDGGDDDTSGVPVSGPSAILVGSLVLLSAGGLILIR